MKAADEDDEAVVALQAGRRVSKKEVTLSIVPAQPGAGAMPRRGAANAAASPLPVSGSSSFAASATSAAALSLIHI